VDENELLSDRRALVVAKLHWWLSRAPATLAFFATQ